MIFISLLKIIGSFFECGKDKNSSWRQTVKMTLSRYSKLFENGYSILQKRGFWKLREGIKPSPLPLSPGLISREKIQCTFNKTIETITSQNYQNDDNHYYTEPAPFTIGQQQLIEIPFPKPYEGVYFEKLGKLFFTAHQFNTDQSLLIDKNNNPHERSGKKEIPFYHLNSPSSPSSKDESIEETKSSEETSKSIEEINMNLQFLMYHIMEDPRSEVDNGTQTTTTSNKISIQFLVH